MKDVELRLISELMKNSRRSDRELAKSIGVSQPTISRLIKKLENQGVIKEYTMIPDFSKLGYGLLAITLASTKMDLTPEQISEARQTATDFVGNKLPQIVMYERLPTAGSTVAISYHRTYSDYVEFVKSRNEHSFMNVDSIQTYLIDLQDKMRDKFFRPLTLSTLAKEITNESARTNEQ
ncbi:MAG: winged helix-turn-helix transcriptional regulator [Candidatus Bathyarchaeia archaeon]|jgi:DNA-binding Lrp family transcriptional regulator